MMSCYLLDLCGGRHLACVLGCVQGHMSFDTISSILPNKINLNNRDGIGPLPQSTELPRGELRWQRGHWRIFLVRQRNCICLLSFFPSNLNFLLFPLPASSDHLPPSQPIGQFSAFSHSPVRIINS